MKLQRQVAYKYKGEKCFKNVVVIPDEIIQKLSWKEGEELVEEVEGSTLFLRPGRPKRLPKSEIIYEEFKSLIKETLEENPQGLTWSEIKSLKGLPQRVPNNLWVKRLERDIGLKRQKVGRKITWAISRG